MGGMDTDLKQEDVRVGVVIADSYEAKGLGPLPGEDSPKILQPLAGRPFIYYTLSLLLNSGVKEVVIFSSRFAQQIRDYLDEGGKGGPRFRNSMKIDVIGNEDACTLGDAMRHIYEAGLVRSNFILTVGCVVGNVNLADVLEEHKARSKDDKDLTMTMVFKEALPGHHLRTAEDQVLLATIPGTKQILHHAPSDNGSKVSFPLELFSRAPQVDISFDAVSTGVAICSPSVPGLFADNFDCQTMQDFVKSCIEDDLADHNLYSKVFSDGYLARVSGCSSYLAVTRDVINRWLHPLVPDSFHYTLGAHQVYKGRDVVLGDSSVLEEDVIVGARSRIGAKSRVQSAAVGEGVTVGNNVRIVDSVIHDKAAIGDDAVVEMSLLGAGCSVGPGARIGQKCVLGPGVQIGAGVTVPSGTWLVAEDDFGGDSSSKYGPKAHPYQLDQDDSDSDEDEDGEKPDEADLKDDWGRDDVTDEDGYESTDSEAESDMDEMEGMDVLLDDDLKTKVFVKEITESLQRGLDEGIDANNLVLEINSSRHAYNMNASQVIRHVTSVVVSISAATPGEEGSNKALLTAVTKNLSKVKDVFANYVKSASDQKDLLKGLENFFRMSPDKLAVVAKIVHHLYDMDLVEERAVVAWCEGLDLDEDCEECSDPDFVSNLRKRMQPLIDWLQQSSSSEEESDSD